MSTPFLGIIVSACVLLLLGVLFRVEKQRGTRFGEGLRRRADYVVLVISGYFDTLFSFLRKDILRQTVHYFFHTLLLSMHAFFSWCQKKVTVLLHTNRSSAQKARMHRRTEGTLHEIREHKLKTALSEEEKQARKDTFLNG